MEEPSKGEMKVGDDEVVAGGADANKPLKKERIHLANGNWSLSTSEAATPILRSLSCLLLRPRLSLARDTPPKKVRSPVELVAQNSLQCANE